MSAGTLQCSIMHACMLQSLLSPQGVTLLLFAEACVHEAVTQASANNSRVRTQALHVVAEHTAMQPS